MVNRSHILKIDAVFIAASMALFYWLSDFSIMYAFLLGFALTFLLHSALFYSSSAALKNGIAPKLLSNVYIVYTIEYLIAIPLLYFFYIIIIQQ